MSARQPRWEIVTTDAGHHVRFRSANGRIIVSSEVYNSHRAALRAIELVGGFPVGTYAGDLGVPCSFGVHDDGLIEVREVDERTGA